ncbi:hypothetical protein B0H16DRAFT_1600884 [Mycena metata]|uniref:DUF6534 domain-containing protein n=1 Tax=Mycena metata TaxID=1033252 RepID=A0AAD7HJI0_9AGAR|nr:hypothetical protein B0H16DRAFT_1600884 [Mycena metata]
MHTPSHHIQIARNESQELAAVVGPVLLGYLFNWCLFGALTVQLYFYYQAFPKDRVFTKSLVYAVYVIESLQTVLATHDAFSNFVYGLDDLFALSNLSSQWFPLPIMSGLVALIGQSFCAYRVYVLSNSWKTPLFIETVSLASSIGAFMTAYFTHQISIYPSVLEQVRSSAVWLGGSALSDIVIAACLTYYLSKSDTGLRRTHILIVRLIWIIIETGCLTALVALTTLILFFARPNSTYFLTPAFVLPILYANTILAVLNSRFQIVDGRGYISTMNMMSTPSFFAHNQVNVALPSSVQSPIISIERETFTARELDDLGESGCIGGDDTHVSSALESKSC